MWRASFFVPAPLADAFADALAEDFQAISIIHADGDGAVRSADAAIEAYGRACPDEAGLSVRLAILAASFGIGEPQLSVERLPPTDWVAATYAALAPMRIGRWYIRGSHHEGHPPAGSLELKIDAATAFGTGDHPTTAGCLLALERLAKRRRFHRVLDMGCGTGILAFAAARLWRSATVLAADIDPEAVRVARINARVNRLHRGVTAVRTDGYCGPVTRAAPFDLVVANILARPLSAMAPDLARHLAPGGVAVLSGLLTAQARPVIAAHRRCGLVLRDAIRINGWTTLVMMRPIGP